MPLFSILLSLTILDGMACNFMCIIQVSSATWVFLIQNGLGKVVCSEIRVYGSLQDQPLTNPQEGLRGVRRKGESGFIYWAKGQGSFE